MSQYSDAVANEGVDPESDGDEHSLISEAHALCVRLSQAIDENQAYMRREGVHRPAPDERLTRICNRAHLRYWRRQDAA
jgi:hypothetical protein